MIEMIFFFGLVALALALLAAWPRIYNAGKRSGYYTGREDQRADDVQEYRNK